MRYTLLEQQRDGLILIARVLLMILFVLFGWEKLIGFSGTVAYMGSIGTPAPMLAAIISVVMEFFVGIAIAVGFWTRPLALLMALYTLGTSLVGHHYWTLTGTAHYEALINFYKNASIIGGLILLCVTGPGKYSFDRK
jgi:putative oxidoreductase